MLKKPCAVLMLTLLLAASGCATPGPITSSPQTLPQLPTIQVDTQIMEPEEPNFLTRLLNFFQVKPSTATTSSESSPPPKP